MKWKTNRMGQHMEWKRLLVGSVLEARLPAYIHAAFDAVDHDVLLHVLQKRFGVECCVLDWFRSYLLIRTHSLFISSGQSASVSLPCSVPQGSRIGRQEFVVYTKDITETIAAFSLNYHLYADDTHLQKNLRIMDITQPV